MTNRPNSNKDPDKTQLDTSKSFLEVLRDSLQKAILKLKTNIKNFKEPEPDELKETELIDDIMEDFKKYLELMHENFHSIIDPHDKIQLKVLYLLKHYLGSREDPVVKALRVLQTVEQKELVLSIVGAVNDARDKGRYKNSDVVLIASNAEFIASGYIQGVPLDRPKKGFVVKSDVVNLDLIKDASQERQEQINKLPYVYVSSPYRLVRAFSPLSSSNEIERVLHAITVLGTHYPGASIRLQSTMNGQIKLKSKTDLFVLGPETKPIILREIEQMPEDSSVGIYCIFLRGSSSDQLEEHRDSSQLEEHRDSDQLEELMKKSNVKFGEARVSNGFGNYLQRRIESIEAGLDVHQIHN